jgi:PAS domain S-box-containing protein
MKLQAKVSLFLSALLLAVLLSLGGGLSYSLDKSLRNKAHQDLLQEAAQVSNRLDAFILNSQTDIMNIAHHMNIQDLLEGKLGKIETYLETVFSTNSRFDNGFFILDAQGVMVVDYPVSENRGINAASRDYFKRTFSEKKPITSSPYLSKRNGMMVISFTVPLLSYQGNFLGLFAGSVNLLRYTFAGNIRDIQTGQTGKIMVYDSKGKIVYSPGIDLTSQEGGPPSADPMLRDLPQGSKGVIDRKAADGTEYSMAFYPLKNTDWIVAVTLPKEEILAPLNRLKKQIVLFLIIALVSAVGIGIWIIGILAKPINAFSNSIKQYKGGDWEEPRGLISRRDEIGELGKSFKTMTSLLSETLNSLTASEIKYRLIADNSNDWIYLIYPDGKFQYVSPSSQRVTGYPSKEFIKDPNLFLTIIHPDDKELVKFHLEEIREETKPHNLEFRIITREGELCWISHSCLPVYNDQGQYISRSGTNREITKRKQAEEALQQAHDELEQRVNARTEELWQTNEELQSEITERKRVEEALLKSEDHLRWLNEHILNMVMVLSHDVRGPLISIVAILKLLLRGSYGKLDQNLANTVKDLLSRCVRLLGTTEDYLGKASIIDGSMVMEREALDLRQDIIDTVLDELADDITKHEIVIDNRLGTIPAGSIAISANKTWLKAVYRNLFTNAIKYGGMGCTISFGFEPCESHYRLNVYNSGNPIPEQDRGKLFVRFGRIETEGRPSPDGVGLGLSLCREIILDHGGEMWYEALPNGSNFVFTISREDVVKR